MKGNKTVIIFLLKFFGTYLVLFLLYSFYLQKTQKKVPVFSCDPITSSVAKQTQFLLNKAGFQAEINQNSQENSVNLSLNQQPVARIIEGCNAISIIILFTAFIVAFAAGFKTTFLYILIGSLVIYITNIFRIAVISVAMFKYPEYEALLHDFIFPSIIYGTTFLLWIIWVKSFSK